MRNREKGNILKNVIATLLIIIQLVNIYIVYSARRFYYLKDVAELDDQAPIKRSCYSAMSSILSKNVSEMIFNDELIYRIKTDNYSFFDFVGGEKIFDVIKGRDDGQCIVIISDKIGLRYFKFSFEGSSDDKHIYRRYVKRIDEITPIRFME